MKSTTYYIFSILVLMLCLVAPSLANAEGETAEANVEITPRSSSTFFSNAFSSANWSVDTAIFPSAPFPEVLKITPMKVADLQFPGNTAMTFNPKASMPVCPDDKLGPPPTSNSIPVPNMIARCPDSLIGNGTAVFGLAQSTNPVATRDGEILIFNGGLSGGLPKLKVYAYSYDTTVGIYTEATLQTNGQLRFEIPQLTSDSSVRSLNLSIPGRRIVIEKPLFAVTVVLPSGQDPDYVRAKCSGNAGYPWSADFTLGSRDNGGNPIGPEFTLSDSGLAPCTGVLAKATITRLSASGPAKVKRGKNAAYKVSIKNGGNAPAKGVRLKVSGKGVYVNAPVADIPAGSTRTTTIRIKPRSIGRIKVTFKAVSSNAGSKTITKTIKVTK